MAKQGSPLEFLSGLFRDWKPIAVIVVFLWALFTLFSVEKESTIQEWQRLAAMPPAEATGEIMERAGKVPGWKDMNHYEQDDIIKRFADEGQLANNIQIIGHYHGYVLFTSLKLGLDLRGGTQLLLLAKPAPPLVPEITQEVMRGVETVINNRINSLGVSETLVQRSGKDRLIVELPGIKDPQQAKDRIGTTALLEFKERVALPNGAQEWKDVGLTGAEFKHAPGLTGWWWQCLARVIRI